MQLNPLIKCLIILLGLKNVVESCMRMGTGGGGGVPVPVCDPNDVQLVAGNNVDSVTPTRTDPVAGADGTTSMTVTCDVSDTPGATTFMEFNNGIGGPARDVNLITADLVCTANGWTYTQDGVTTVINSVNCLRAAPASAPVCDPNDVQLVAGNNVDSVTPTRTDPVAGADGTTSMTVTCDVSDTPGATTFMQFNGNIAPQDPTGVIMATLVCTADGWTYSQNGPVVVVNSVNCLRTAPPPAAACDLNDITLVPGDNVNSITPTTPGPVVGADGTTTMTVTCDASNIANAQTLVLDQDEVIIGNTMGAPVDTTMLVCDGNGNWNFERDGVTKTITQITCELFVDVCAPCPLSTINFVPGDADTHVDVQRTEPTVDNDQCEVTVTCTPRNAGGDVFMQFNGNEGGPANNMATFSCTTGDWLFNQAQPPITMVECLG
ncbi:hypothetical protein FO519_008959 [Halicephalobus sp. NKZ332]|nr:hypothetical protein FO519_008959 [Halicephalobus sp. NKZ332]